MERIKQRGFTLIELLVVVTIIGILAGVAAVNVQGTLRKAKENTLKNDLRVMRDLLQQYKIDKKKYPDDLDALVPDYLRAIPVDTITTSPETWIPIFAEPDPEEDPALQDTGVIDVLSGAEGVDSNGVPFEEY